MHRRDLQTVARVALADHQCPYFDLAARDGSRSIANGSPAARKDGAGTSFTRHRTRAVIDRPKALPGLFNRQRFRHSESYLYSGAALSWSLFAFMVANAPHSIVAKTHYTSDGLIRTALRETRPQEDLADDCHISLRCGAISAYTTMSYLSISGT
jgi:hypothetical protein